MLAVRVQGGRAEEAGRRREPADRIGTPGDERSSQEEQARVLGHEQSERSLLARAQRVKGKQLIRVIVKAPDDGPVARRQAEADHEEAVGDDKLGKGEGRGRQGH